MDTKTLIIMVLIFSSWPVREIKTQSDNVIYFAPEKVKWYAWTFHLSNEHLTDMSAEIVRDATYKLEIAYKIQSRYRSAYAFQIGIVTSGINNDFEKMLNMYRDYSNLTKIRNVFRNATVLMEGFAVMQGLYNKIRFDKTLFVKMVSKRKAEIDRLQQIYDTQFPILTGQKAPSSKRRTENLNQQRKQTPRIDANTNFGRNHSNMKTVTSKIKLGLPYRGPEKPKEFVRPRISLGERYWGPYQGLPAAKVTRATTKKPLWKFKVPSY